MKYFFNNTIVEHLYLFTPLVSSIYYFKMVSQAKAEFSEFSQNVICLRYKTVHHKLLGNTVATVVALIFSYFTSLHVSYYIIV